MIAALAPILVVIVLFSIMCVSNLASFVVGWRAAGWRGLVPIMRERIVWGEGARLRAVAAPVAIVVYVLSYAYFLAS